MYVTLVKYLGCRFHGWKRPKINSYASGCKPCTKVSNPCYINEVLVCRSTVEFKACVKLMLTAVYVNLSVIFYRAGLGSMVSEDLKIPNRFVGLSEFIM